MILYICKVNKCPYMIVICQKICQLAKCFLEMKVEKLANLLAIGYKIVGKVIGKAVEID